MGCDIHVYIEYERDWGNKKDWENFGGRINPGRHYGIFAKLVGVRNYDGYEITPISEPKGLPSDISWSTKSENIIRVNDQYADQEGYCTVDTAESWVKSGSSVRLDKDSVTHPDHHSHSWATADELDAVFNDPKTQFNAENEAEWLAVRDCLRSFEKNGHKARIVFWFDN